MRWSEFLDSAERLVQGSTEGDWRSAISRGYYAVFHQLRDFLLSHGINVGQSGQSHFTLYAGLFNCGIPAVALIGNRLDVLRRRRGWADYDLQRAIIHSLARDVVTEARAITVDFENLLTSVPPPQITAGARRYLQSIGRIGPIP